MKNKKSGYVVVFLLSMALILSALACAGEEEEAAQPTATRAATPTEVAPTKVPTAEPSPTPKLEPTAVPTPTKKPAEEAKPAPKGFDKMINAWAGVKTFRSKTASKMQDQPMEVLTEAVLPDRFHTKMSMTGMTMESIMIGEAVYTKIGDGPWQKMAIPGGPTPEAGQAETKEPGDVIKEMFSSVTVEKVGSEKVDGVQCTIYSYKFGGEEGTPIKMWIADKDNLPRKMEMTLAGSTIVTTYYDYNAAITIEAPL